MARAITTPARLAARERALLVVPMAVAGAVGLGLLLVPGNRYVGAEGVACALALGSGLRSGDWTAARLPVVAAFAINAAALCACIAAGAGGQVTSRVLLAASMSLVGAVSAGWVLLMRRGVPRPAPDIARWVVALIVLRTVVAAALGAAPLLAPALFVHAFGVPGADLFFYRVGGAALVGYAIMGLGEVRSRSWRELRTPAAAVLVLAGLCAVVSLGSLAIGERTALGYLVAALTCVVTAATVVELRRGGV